MKVIYFRVVKAIFKKIASKTRKRNSYLQATVQFYFFIKANREWVYAHIFFEFIPVLFMWKVGILIKDDY